jgi:hypothetical protein
MQKDTLEDYGIHFQNAKSALNESYALSIASEKSNEAIKMAKVASSEATKFMQALRIALEK